MHQGAAFPLHHAAFQVLRKSRSVASAIEAASPRARRAMEGELAEARAAAEDAEAAAAQLEALRRIEAAARAAAAAEHQARAALPASPGTPCRALPCARAAPAAAAGACIQVAVRVLARPRGGTQRAPLGAMSQEKKG